MTEPNDFPPNERPTPYVVTSLAVEAAQLVRDWKDCPREYQRMLLRLAQRGAKLPKKPKP